MERVEILDILKVECMHALKSQIFWCLSVLVSNRVHVVHPSWRAKRVPMSIKRLFLLVRPSNEDPLTVRSLVVQQCRVCTAVAELTPSSSHFLRMRPSNEHPFTVQKRANCCYNLQAKKTRKQNIHECVSAGFKSQGKWQTAMPCMLT